MKNQNDIILYTPEEAASIIKMHANTVRKWLRSGSIKGVKIGSAWRIPDHELERLKRGG